MECRNCGALNAGDAEVCAECGEPIVAHDAAERGDLAPLEESVERDDLGARDTMADSEVPPAEAAAPSEVDEESKRPWLVPVVIGVIVLAVLAAAAYYLFGMGGLGVLTGNEPGTVATRMLQAYANYDAQGILDNATHGNLPASGINDFKKQAADAKKKALGKPGVKDLKVVKVTLDPKDPNKATVEISGSWLVDPAKGSYATRTEQLQMVKENGKWLVKLFV